ncbi:MAG TPA: hypothetical protein VMU63_01970 [Acidimicrobiales bacterium]|nr:hypothetical protein [Acidimicrobiales bacterium]
MKFRVLAAVALAVGLVTAACGGGSSVGSGVNLNGKGGGGALSLGSTTTTTLVATTTIAPTATTRAPSATPTSPPPTSPRTTAPPAPVYTITIESDSSGQPPFNPPDVAVYQGTPVKWVNSDSKAHSVVASDGAFNSGPIAPGASWTWVASSVGKHSYADGTRPYAVGTLEVAQK